MSEVQKPQNHSRIISVECGLCTWPMVLVMDLIVDQSAFFAALIMGRNMMLITACWFSEHTTSQVAETIFSVKLPTYMHE